MTIYYLKLTLQTDATFGRGDGIAVLVDVEVEHDQYGMPYLRGRELHKVGVVAMGVTHPQHA